MASRNKERPCTGNPSGMQCKNALSAAISRPASSAPAVRNLEKLVCGVKPGVTSPGAGGRIGRQALPGGKRSLAMLRNLRRKRPPLSAHCRLLRRRSIYVLANIFAYMSPELFGKVFMRYLFEPCECGSGKSYMSCCDRLHSDASVFSMILNDNCCFDFCNDNVAPSWVR